MNLSIVIPLLNEEESINELYHWIAERYAIQWLFIRTHLYRRWQYR